MKNLVGWDYVYKYVCVYIVRANSNVKKDFPIVVGLNPVLVEAIIFFTLY